MIGTVVLKCKWGLVHVRQLGIGTLRKSLCIDAYSQAQRGLPSSHA